ncbi:MAG: CaiB/BaiF CoA transferase family protein [Streptosporangiales bacterium]
MVSGPLSGFRVVEIASIAPAPFGCTVLSDLGAEVLRVDRASNVPEDPPTTAPPDPLARGRGSVGVDLKNPAGAGVVLRLVESADVLVEGFRPGVCERLGVGPAECLAANPRLVYGRLSGYGQDGPLAGAAGHDIDYLAYAGALHPIGPAGAPPLPPVNYVADFGGGGMLLAVGVLAALLERERSGRGQVVDAAMVEGAAAMTGMLHGLRASGVWRDERGTNFLDGGAPFYRCYSCADGRFVAVGALEPQFYAALLAGFEIDPATLPGQHDREYWPEIAEQFAVVFATRTRDEWAELFAGTDACVAPVLTPAEAPRHPHAAARGTFVEVDGLVQPGPAPRLDRTPGSVGGPAPYAGQHSNEALGAWGFGPAEIDELRAQGAIR